MIDKLSSIPEDAQFQGAKLMIISLLLIFILMFFLLG